MTWGNEGYDVQTLGMAKKQAMRWRECTTVGRVVKCDGKREG